MSDASLRGAHRGWLAFPGADEHHRYVRERGKIGLHGLPPEDPRGARALLAEWPRFKVGKKKGQLKEKLTYDQAQYLIRLYYRALGWLPKLNLLYDTEEVPPTHFASHVVGGRPFAALPKGFPVERDPKWMPIQGSALISPDFSTWIGSSGQRTTIFRAWDPGQAVRHTGRLMHEGPLETHGYWRWPRHDERWELIPSDSFRIGINNKILAQRLLDASLRVEDPFHPNPARDDRHYRFLTDCIHSDRRSITSLTESARKITRRTFQRKIAPGQWAWIQKKLGYDKRVTLAGDPFVGYFQGTYRGVPAVFFVWSGIEQVFTLDGMAGPNPRMDLTGDRPLTKAEAKKLARWWTSRGFSTELIKVRPDRFRVITTSVVVPKSRKALGLVKKNPNPAKLRIKITEPWQGVLAARAYVGRRRAGHVVATHYVPGYWDVTSAEVYSQFRRQGIATALYQAAAKAVCERHGKPLRTRGWQRSGLATRVWKQLPRAVPLPVEGAHMNFMVPCPNPPRLMGRLDALRSQLATTANQAIAEFEWEGGGACDAVAQELGGVLVNAGIDSLEGGHPGDDHAWLVAYDEEAGEAAGVDIPPSVYETGGGYSWKQLQGAMVTPEDLVFWPIPFEDIRDRIGDE